MTALKNPNEQEQAQIHSYLAGEMTAEQAAAFERRMRADEALRRHTEEWRQAIAAARDWVESEAPGVERVDSLPIPSVSRATLAKDFPLRLPQAARRASLWRWVAVAAVFLAGFVVGHLSQPKPPAGDRERPTAGIQEPTVQITGEGQRETGPMRAQVPARLADLPEPARPSHPERTRPARFTSEDNGRLLIETTLQGSGARAIWVVDGNFELTQSKGGTPS